MEDMRTEDVLRELAPTVERLLAAPRVGRTAWNLLAEIDRTLTMLERLLRTWRRKIRRGRPYRSELVRGILTGRAWEQQLRDLRESTYVHLVGRDRCQRLALTRLRHSQIVRKDALC